MFDLGIIKRYLVDNFMQTARPDANMRIMIDSARQEVTSFHLRPRVRAGTASATAANGTVNAGSLNNRHS